VVAAFLALKFLLHLGHFSDLGFGFWLGLVLTVLLVFAALRISRGQPILPAGTARVP
jgi:hypothetical protein